MEAQPAESSPPWVQAGEEWHPANGIMPLEDFGNCPKGHTGPSGYTYKGYTTGDATTNYSDIAAICSIVSILSKDILTVKASALTSTFLAWLESHKNTTVKYFKYTYIKGSAKFFHIIYAEKISDKSNYIYLTCETYYE